jgi:hypothetical protein
MSDWVTVNHDGFARQATVRRIEHRAGATCDWCGQVRRNGSLFVYGTMRDDGFRVNEHRGRFCCKGCHDAYHG